MKDLEFGEVVFDFDSEYRFNPYAGNAGASCGKECKILCGYFLCC